MFIFLFGVLLLKLKIIDDDKGKEEEAGDADRSRIEKILTYAVWKFADLRNYWLFYVHENGSEIL